MSILFEREWYPSDGDVGQNTFSLMSYNILNDQFTTDGYTYVNPELMLTSRRLPLTAKEVIHYSPDIVCMQEIGECAFNDVTSRLASHGYEGKHAKKTKGDGLAAFFKSSRYNLITSKSLPVTFSEFSEQHLIDQELSNYLIAVDIVPDEAVKKIEERVRKRLNALLLKLKDKKLDKIVNIGTIHTSFGEFKYFDAQCLQLTVALDALFKFSNNGTEPYIMCGDFNTSPTMPTYRWILEGKLDKKLIDDIQQLCKNDGEVVDITVYLKNSLKHSCKFESCYKKAMGKEPDITNCDDGFGFFAEECLDYIFINPDFLDVSHVLKTPASSFIKKDCALPNDIFPSDHISIMARMCFKETDS